jgi:peptidoglycan/xylan/chitin deacetylase (PgdA/CDA1 family)
MNIPIITYHAVGDGPRPLWLSAREFNSHLEAFSRCGHRSIRLSELDEVLNGTKPAPSNAIVLTFDDGYRNFHSHAWPSLSRWGFAATVFLISDYCGHDNGWPTQSKQTPREPLLSWAQVNELSRQGCDFGAHSRTHSPLTLLSENEIRREVCESAERIRQETGQDVETFAYPYGAVNRAVISTVRRAFKVAVGTRLGFANSGSDLFLLPRIDAYYLSPASIERLSTPAFRAYLALRQGIRGTRGLVSKPWAQS